MTIWEITAMVRLNNVVHVACELGRISVITKHVFTLFLFLISAIVKKVAEAYLII